jgi:Domain of unknown function (DUF4136)
MKVPRVVLGVCVFILIGGLSFARKVRIDFDHRANFSKYHTFAWAKEPETDDPFMKQRIINAINSQLMLKGLELDTSHADLAIVANASTQEIQTLNTYYSGWDWGGGWATTTVDTTLQGTLVVDILDAKTNKPLWRGITTHSISSKPEKASHKLQKEIQEMFESFPPLQLR